MDLTQLVNLVAFIGGVAALFAAEASRADSQIEAES